MRALLLAAALVVLTALPAASATVSLVPSDTTAIFGDEFSIRVRVDDAVDLMCFKAIFGYDTRVIELVRIEPGPMVSEATGEWVGYPVPDVEAPLDTARYDACVLGGSVSGSGVIAVFRFRAVGMGLTHITCVTVDFRDPDNVQTFPPCTGSDVTDDLALRVEPASWGRLKAIWR